MRIFVFTVVAMMVAAAQGSLPPSLSFPLNRQPIIKATSERPTKPHGRWYMGADGHAVFCYGPVMTVVAADGSIEKIATFCRDKIVVKLKD